MKKINKKYNNKYFEVIPKYICPHCNKSYKNLENAVELFNNGFSCYKCQLELLKGQK